MRPHPGGIDQLFYGAYTIGEIEHGSPFLLYDMQRGLNYTGTFHLPDDNVWSHRETLIDVRLKPTYRYEPMHIAASPTAAMLGLCPYNDGSWDTRRFCVPVYRGFTHRFTDDFIVWLEERAPYDGRARRTLRRLLPEAGA